MIVVYYKSEVFLLYPVIAQRLGLTNGQVITNQAQFWHVVDENATHYALLGQFEAERPMN